MKLRRANALPLNTLPLNTLPLNTLILLATTLTICLPTAAAAQTTLGSVALGATSTSVVSIALPAAARLASISVGTQGAAYLDFANAGGGSCRVGVSYAAGATCTVKVAFTPKFAGARYGAVVLASSTGVVATAYLQGVGNGPQVSYLPGTLTTVKSGSEAVTNGVAADASGNYYIPDSSHRRVLKETLKNGVYVETSIGTNLTSPYAVAVDGAGNLFVANIAIPSLGIQAGSLFKETLLDGKYIESEIAIPFSSLTSVALDGAGNVFVVDGDMTIDELSPVPGGYSVTNLPPAPFSGAASLNGVYAVAVDGFGNLYVTISYLYDNYGGTIIKYAGELYKYTLSNGVYTPTTGFFLTGFPATVAVDGDGDIYLANSKLNSLWAEIGVTEFLPQPNGTYYEIAIPMQAYDPIGVAVDGAGNVFIVDGGVTNSGAGTPTITRVARSTPPSLDFASTPFGSVQEGPYKVGTAPTSPQTVTLLNSGNAPLALSGIDYPTDFTPFPYLDAPPASDCFLGQSVASRQTCNLVIDFSPEQPLNGKTSIAIKEAVTLETNAPIAGTAKAIPVAGLETRPTGALTLFASSDPYQPGQSLTFTATVTAPSGLPTPTGTVTFSDGENIPVICKSTLTAGVATCVTSALSGSQVLGAVYSGDSIYAGSSTQLQMEQATSPVPPSASVANFGSVNIGSSVTLPVTFTFTSSQTVAAISVTTGDSYNLDFTGQTGGTCAAGVTYSPGAACTVNVRFAPRTPGQIRGAVQLDGTSAAWIANAYIRGVGVGPQTVFSPGTRTKLASLGAPAGLAVDESGRLIVAAQGLLSQQASAGSASFSKIGGYGWECNSTAGIALDGAGNLVLASGTCYSGFVVYAQVQGVSGLTYISSQMISPQGVAVDAAGSAYVADQATGILYKLTPAAGSYSQTEIASGFLHPLGVAADASGNLYIADFGSGPDGPSGAVYKETLQPNGTYLRSSIGSGWTSPSALAVDTMGSVYVADFGNILTGGAVPGSVVKETPAGATYKASPLGGWFPGSNAGPNQGWIAPTGIAVDRFGNVYVADEGDGNIYELNLANPPSIAFGYAQLGAAPGTDTATVELENIGNAPLTFPIPASGKNPAISANFTLKTGGASDCPLVPAASKSPGALAPGASCLLPISFTPSEFGELSGTLSLITNTLNATAPKYKSQTLQLSGRAIKDAQTIQFAALKTHLTYGTAPIALSAKASSGLAVKFAVTGPATLTGNTLTITGAGTVVVTASQAGNAEFAPAPTVSQTITVAKALLAVKAQNATRPYGKPNPTFTATITGFLKTDTAATALYGAPSLTTTAKSISAPGNYPIVAAPGTLAAKNYTFQFTNGTLTIQ